MVEQKLLVGIFGCKLRRSIIHNHSSQELGTSCMSLKFNIINYSAELDSDLLELEKQCPQGTAIKLEMVRGRFCDRAAVFKDWRIIVAIDDATSRVIGTQGAADVPIVIDGQEIRAGYFFDARVHPAFRGMGVAAALNRYLSEHYLQAEGINKFFVTTKETNAPSISNLSKLGIAHQYRFQYLSFSTANMRARYLPNCLYNTGFSVCDLSADSSEELFNRYDHCTVFRTDLLYQIKIVSMPALLRCIGMVARPFLKMIPNKNQIIGAATVFDLKPGFEQEFVNVSQRLSVGGISYINMVGSGFVLNKLHHFLNGINIYPYLLVSNFEINEKSSVIIDVRCL